MKEDFNLTLFDRVNVIKDMVKKYGEENFYISFSGGKDSTILHYLIDEALPNNNIPRVFNNTGMEYIYIVNFVKEMKQNDNRFVIINNTKPIISTLEQIGYPFKSKEHSYYVDNYQRLGMKPYMNRYLEGSKWQACPKVLRYQFSSDNKLRISSKCCDIFKKKPLKDYQKENNKPYAITGMRKGEGGFRAQMSGCITFKDKKLSKFNPLYPISDKFEEWYIETRDIKLCELYYSPFNFTRTGCKGCPYAINLQKELDVLEEILPNEKKQCEIIWKPVYYEYRRLNYRLEGKRKDGNKESN